MDLTETPIIHTLNELYYKGLPTELLQREKRADEIDQAVVIQCFATHVVNHAPGYFRVTNSEEEWNQPKLDEYLQQFGMKSVSHKQVPVNNPLFLNAKVQCLVATCDQTNTMFVSFGGSTYLGDWLMDADVIFNSKLYFVPTQTDEPTKKRSLISRLFGFLHSSSSAENIKKQKALITELVSSGKMTEDEAKQSNEYFIYGNLHLKNALIASGMSKEEIDGILVHGGVIQGYNQIRGFVMDTILSQITDKVQRIVFTAHSLGSALCTLAAIDLQLILYGVSNTKAPHPAHLADAIRRIMQIDKINLYTTGGLAVGNSNFAKFARRILPNNWHFVNGDDLTRWFGEPFLDTTIGTVVKITPMPLDPATTLQRIEDFLLPTLIRDHIERYYINNYIHGFCIGNYQLTPETQAIASETLRLHELFKMKLLQEGGQRRRKQSQRRRQHKTSRRYRRQKQTRKQIRLRNI